MKNTLLTFTLLAGMTMTGSVFAACSQPADPEIPSGDTASGADMLKAKKAVEAYVADMEKYLSCGIANNEAKRAEDQMKDIADRYNQELRTYKAKS